MEVDISLKSILKKPKSVNQNKHRKVSFSNTAKLFFSEKYFEGTSGKFQLKYVEVNIVDKSMTVSSNTLIFDDCKAEDFLVHKVIYNSDVVPEDDTDMVINNEEQDNDLESGVHYVEVDFNSQTRNSVELNENCKVDKYSLTDSNISIVSSSSTFKEQREDDEHDFVVHKVDLEEDRFDYVVHKVPLIEDQELVLGNCSFLDALCSTSTQNSTQASSLDCFDVAFESKPCSELSIQNIQEHDKIIAYNDQSSLNSSSVVGAMSNVLMLENLIDFEKLDKQVLQSPVTNKKMPDNIVLSPPLQELSLDKIVRAHSDSILCELDISPLNSVQETDSDSDISSEDTMIMMTSEECQKNEKHILQSLLQYQSIKESKSNVNDKSVSLVGNTIVNEVKENRFEDDLEIKSLDCAHQEQVLLNSICNQVVKLPSQLNQESAIQLVQNDKKLTVLNKELCADDGYCDTNFSSGLKNTFRTSTNWDKTLLTVEIPKDVREWKIMPITKHYSCFSNGNKTDPNVSFEGVQSFSKPLDFPQASKSDELEHFVNESNERVERIRKRYYSNNQTQLKFEQSPIRGVKPRFGSTAEIIQLMRKQNTSLLHYDSTRNHVSWPFSDNNEYRAVNHNKEYSSSEHLDHKQRQAGIYSPLSGETMCSNVCDHFSYESCPPVERGVPEGANPPRSLAEHFKEEIDNDQISDSMVYYSMKV